MTTFHQQAISTLERLLTGRVGGRIEAVATCNECPEEFLINLMSGVTFIKREQYVGTVCPDFSLFDRNGSPVRFIEVVDSHAPGTNVHEYALANDIEVYELHLQVQRQFLGTRRNKALDESLTIKARLQELANGEIHIDAHNLLCQRPKCDECNSRLPLRAIHISTKDCWKCGKAVTVAIGSSDGHDLVPDDFTEEEASFAESNGVTLDRRFSYTIKDRYLANICPHCDQIQGNWFLYNDPLHDCYNIHRTSREAYGPCDACHTFHCWTHGEYVDYNKTKQCPACLKELERATCPNNPEKDCFYPRKCESTECYFITRERQRVEQQRLRIEQQQEQERQQREKYERRQSEYQQQKQKWANFQKWFDERQNAQ